MNAEPTVMIRLDGEGKAHWPGEALSGEYWIASIEPVAIKAIETSVLWYTEGKGDEDMAVVAFWRRNAEDGWPLDSAWPARFTTTLPNSPLSYDGQIVKLHWCVRVRVFQHRGRDIVGEKRFQLGDVPRVGLRSLS